MSGIYHMETFGGVEYTREDTLKTKFKNFLKEFYEGPRVYIYRDQLRDHFNLGQYWINVCLEDLDSYDEILCDRLKKNPLRLMEIFETAATEVCDDVTKPRKEGYEDVPNIQVMLTSVSRPIALKDLTSDMVSKFVTVSGIVVAATTVRAKAISIALQCQGCRDIVPNVKIRRGLDGYTLPRKCPTQVDPAGGRLTRCPLDPYNILPDKSKMIDFQVLKLQELPEATPQGGMPKHLKLYCDRYLCDKFAPGNRVTLFGSFSIVKIGKPTNPKGAESNVKVGLRSSYLHVIGYTIQTMGPGHAFTFPYTPEEEEEFRILASSEDCYKRIYSSIAPSIYGFDDVKKAIATFLFSGSVKNLPDGTKRRGDINVLLLGDPGTAKSQMLKFAEMVAPIGVYTSGKGSSAAGLTASVIREGSSRNFAVEGGAMVLADGGIVCIDEFDKMREDDRVAIHEAMEQQTISIAKAGITVTLNSRCAVLAAANSVQGKWDDLMSAEENMDFMPTILSRFDMIFVIKDKYDYQADMEKARHVVSIHADNGRGVTSQDESSDLSLDFLKKYISYCKAKVGPRISESAGKLISDKYVEMRNGPEDSEANDKSMGDDGAAHQKHVKKSIIPITVRQLEAAIRISESLAKMELKPFAREEHVEEALRLFQESTLKAAKAGHLTGGEGLITEKDMQTMTKIEKLIRRRLSYDPNLDRAALMKEFEDKDFNLNLIKMVIARLIGSGGLVRKKGKLVHQMK